LARIVERIGRSDWSRLFVMAGATMGTFLTTFAVVLNNHLHAAVCAMIVLYALVHIWLDDRRSPWLFRAAGFFAAMLVANELPGLALAAAVTVGLAFRFPRQTALHFVPAAALVAVAFFGLNYVAHESLRPPYAHRSKTDPDDDWYRYEFTRRGTTVKSYWHDPKGIDAGEPSAGRYALHVLIGHHGIFSLTPMWILSIVGLAMMMRRRDDDDLRPLALLAGTVSIAVIGFYLLRPQVDRNYGGMTSGFRWVYWLAPLWLAAMLPALDRAARSRTLRIATAVLLGLSVLSASYPTWNPWTHPWLMNLALYLE
jgi:hypothetical protein